MDKEVKETRIKIRPDCEIVIHTPVNLTVEELDKITRELYHAVDRRIKGGQKLYGDTH